jgi:conjugal transfer pilus assembly protein TraW
MNSSLLKTAAAIALGLSISTSTFAKDLGRHGPMWEIAEPSLLDTIHERLAEMERNGQLETMKQEMQETTRAYVNRPRPVMGLNKTKVANSFVVDLSITLNRDLTDHKGRVFARKGTRINPLDYSHFNQTIIMFDGDDPEQVEFALSRGNELDTLLVLTNGAPLELMRKHGRRFWFDQDAQLVSKFEIQFLPSVVRRDGNRMVVEEIVVGEGAQ